MTMAPTIDDRTARPEPLAVKVERWWPTVIGVAGGLAAAVWGPALEAFCASRNWSFSELYGGFFNFASIAVGGLLAAYALLVTDTTRTLKQLRRTRALARFLGFVRYSIGASLLLAIISIPTVVVKPSFSKGDVLETALACVWACLVFALIASIARVFGTIRALTED